LSQDGHFEFDNTIVQDLTTLASVIPEIFKDVQNFKVGHLTLTMHAPFRDG